MQANAAGCKVSEGLLDCGSGDDASVATALADNKTSQLFAAPGRYKAVFNGKAHQRELFRKSLEKTRLKVEKYGRATRNAFNRSEISEAELATRTALYEKAIAAYGEGYWLYKNLRWQSN